MNDLKLAFRQLRKSPGFTLVAVLTLALGIGANTAIFSVVQNILFQPLPYANSARLYAIWASSESTGQRQIAASGPDYLDYRDQNRSFAHIAEYLPRFTFTWTGEGEPKLVTCTGVSGDFFATLGVHAYLGRLYEPREYTYWKTTRRLCRIASGRISLAAIRMSSAARFGCKTTASRSSACFRRCPIFFRTQMFGRS